MLLLLLLVLLHQGRLMQLLQLQVQQVFLLQTLQLQALLLLLRETLLLWWLKLQLQALLLLLRETLLLLQMHGLPLLQGLLQLRRLMRHDSTSIPHRHRKLRRGAQLAVERGRERGAGRVPP